MKDILKLDFFELYRTIKDNEIDLEELCRLNKLRYGTKRLLKDILFLESSK